MTRIGRAFAAFVSALSIAVPHAALAAPPPSRSSVDACIAASESSQVERAKGHLRAARAALSRCLAADCPALISKDCNAFLAQLEAITPTIVFRVLDAAGRDFVDAEVRVDGELVMPKVDGRARPFDPGPHDVEVRAPGEPVLTQRVVAEEGVKARVIEFRFAGPAPQPSTATAPSAPVARPSEGETTTNGPSTGTVVTSAALGGLGLVALGTFAAVGLKANSDYDRLQNTCGSRCPPDEVDRLHGRYQLADVALAIGIGAIAAAAVVFFVGPRRDEGTRAAAIPLRVRF